MGEILMKIVPDVVKNPSKISHEDFSPKTQNFPQINFFKQPET